jgi:hypothetical protein
VVNFTSRISSSSIPISPPVISTPSRTPLKPLLLRASQHRLPHPRRASPKPPISIPFHSWSARIRNPALAAQTTNWALSTAFCKRYVHSARPAIDPEAIMAGAPFLFLSCTRLLLRANEQAGKKENPALGAEGSIVGAFLLLRRRDLVSLFWGPWRNLKT